MPTDFAADFSVSLTVSGPHFALTFDDGPLQNATPHLLDALAKTEMRATFCVVGKNVASHPDIFRRLLDAGHEVANHSYSHPHFNKLSDNAVRNEISRTDAIIEKIAGAKPIYFRPPYGELSEEHAALIQAEFGHQLLYWSFDSQDYTKPPPGVITERILSGIAPGQIVLAHDSFPQSVAEMPGILEQIAARGLRSVTVSELISLSRAA